jgi:hypothetical protein
VQDVSERDFSQFTQSAPASRASQILHIFGLGTSHLDMPVPRLRPPSAAAQAARSTQLSLLAFRQANDSRLGGCEVVHRMTFQHTGLTQVNGHNRHLMTDRKLMPHVTYGPLSQEARKEMEEKVRSLIDERDRRCSFCGRPRLEEQPLTQGRIASICTRCVRDFRAHRETESQMGDPKFMTEGGPCAMIGCGRSGQGWALLGGKGFICRRCVDDMRPHRGGWAPSGDAIVREDSARQVELSCAFCERTGDQVGWAMGGVGPPLRVCGDCLDSFAV